MAKKYYCPVCGYESDEPIDVCPVCGAKMAVREEGETSWAAEHKVGIIDGVSEEIVNGLRENFQGECTEVGMYLAMARVAHREGYPEIGLYWEKAAYEEAEHAAKFAEMLGEVVTDSTKKNLEMRAAAENGATLSLQSLLRSRVLTQSTTLFMRWQGMKPVMERHSRVFLRDILHKF